LDLNADADYCYWGRNWYATAGAGVMTGSAGSDKKSNIVWLTRFYIPVEFHWRPSGLMHHYDLYAGYRLFVMSGKQYQKYMANSSTGLYSEIYGGFGFWF
jgi:hypothetical protein